MSSYSTAVSLLSPMESQTIEQMVEDNCADYLSPLHVSLFLSPLPSSLSIADDKGVFPREPKKKVKGSHHTYYHLKDVSFIQHELLLERLREIRAYERKVKKANVKKNKERAALLKERRPTYKLDIIILQRYPKFVHSLRDIDDCLTMVHLFAALPAIEDRIDVKRIHKCQSLSLLSSADSLNCNHLLCNTCTVKSSSISTQRH